MGYLETVYAVYAVYAVYVMQKWGCSNSAIETIVCVFYPFLFLHLEPMCFSWGFSID